MADMVDLGLINYYYTYFTLGVTINFNSIFVASVQTGTELASCPQEGKSLDDRTLITIFTKEPSIAWKVDQPDTKKVSAKIFRYLSTG